MAKAAEQETEPEVGISLDYETHEITKRWTCEPGMVPDQAVQYHAAGRKLRPDAVLVIYKRGVGDDGALSGWALEKVAVTGFQVKKDGKPSASTRATNRYYEQGKLSGWLVDLVRENTPQD